MTRNFPDLMGGGFKPNILKIKYILFEPFLKEGATLLKKLMFKSNAKVRVNCVDVSPQTENGN